MKTLAAILLTVLASCAATDSQRPDAHSSSAQAVVDRFASQHAEIARLSIHAIHPGESRARIIASTVAGRIGELSDPEDVRSLATGEAIVLQEGLNLDYTAPALDAQGRTLAVIGITISGTSDGQFARAKELAQQIEAELRAHGQPLL